MGVNISNNSVQDSNTTQKKPRNLWPYGILFAIFIGIILICISVYISVKHPVYDDRPFFQKHSDTDTMINQLLEDTSALQEHYDFYIQANLKPTKDSVLKPNSPYLRPPHRDKQEDNSPNILLTKTLNTIYLLADKVDSKSQTLPELSIEVFIQKIGDIKAQEIYIYDTKDGSFVKSVPEHKGAQIPIGKMMFDAREQVFVSPSFEIELEGRWIISLQITAKQNPAQQATQGAQDCCKDLFVVLEKEFFSMPKPQ